MTETVAKTIVIAGGLVGACVWMLSLWLYLKMKSMPRRPTERKTIKGKSKDQAMRILLKEAARTISPATGRETRIVEKTDDSVTLQLPLCRLRIGFESESGDVCLNMQPDFTRLWRVFGSIMAALVLLLNPVWIIGVCLLLWFLAVPNNNPAVRWQVVQVLQVIHAIYMPLVVYFLFRKFRGAVETLSAHLPILVEISE